MHKQDALTIYKDKVSAHINATIIDAGLFINQERSHIGTSPDAIIISDCCGQGTVEVKCPYCFKDKLLEENAKNFCLRKDKEGT